MSMLLIVVIGGMVLFVVLGCCLLLCGVNYCCCLLVGVDCNVWSLLIVGWLEVVVCCVMFAIIVDVVGRGCW